MALHIVVSGRVQGVGYRFFVRKNALLMGISGYVRNETNGDVTIVASGKPELLNELLRCCYQGPSGARVTNIEYTQVPDGDFSTFEIK